MDSFYREHILEHYKNPRNWGHIPDPDVQHDESNPLCGDKLHIELKFRDENGKHIVDEVRFNGRGCAISQASASMLSEMIEGKTREELAQIRAEDVMDLLGIEISPARVKCALLSLKTLKLGLFEHWDEEDIDE